MRTVGMGWLFVGAVSVALAACGSDSDKRPATKAGKSTAAPDDRTPVQSQPNEPPVSDSTPTPARPDPAGRPEPFARPRDRGRMIEITLRSSPPGAEAAVDGRIVGPTPTYWRGPMTGHPHEFTFVKPEFAMARYRFVPTTNGVVHATLNPVTTGGQADAGPDAQ